MQIVCGLLYGMLYGGYLVYGFCSLLCSNYTFYVFIIGFMFVLLFVCFYLYCVCVLVLFCVLFFLLYIIVSFYLCTCLLITAIGWKTNCS
jgi:hypothetical protein